MKRKALSILATLLLFGGLYFMNYGVLKRFAPKWRDSTVSTASTGNSTLGKMIPTDTNQMPVDSMYTHSIQGRYVQPEFNLRDTLFWIGEHSKIVR